MQQLLLPSRGLIASFDANIGFSPPVETYHGIHNTLGLESSD